MFSKLKEKLKSWFKKTEEEVKEEPVKLEKQAGKEKIKKKVEKTLLKPKKQQEKLETPKPEETEIKEPLEEIKKTEEEAKEESEERKSIFTKLKEKFKKTTITEEKFEDFFSELETLLLENNTAIEAIEKIKAELKSKLLEKQIEKDKIEEEIKTALKQSISNLMIPAPNILEKIKAKPESEPFKIVFLGINGSGKTTSIAKLANMLKQQNIPCILAASDTFRAAAIDQLQKHGDNLNIKVIKGQYGADPTSIAFDAVKYAHSHKIKAVLIDTAGRMHTKENLIREIEKICRVIKPDLKIFVGESIAGHDIIEQAKTFNKAVGIDGIILSKADVDERGGSAISISYITNKPILFLGVGQEYSDLQPFDKEKILSNIFE